MPKYFFSNGTGLTNLSGIDTDDVKSDYPKLTPPSIRKPQDDPDCLFDWYKVLKDDLNKQYGLYLGTYKKEETMKTVVKCSQYDEYDPYFGFLAALAKKVYGNPSRVRKIVDKWAPEEEEPLNDTAKAFKTVMESVQGLAERFNKATNDKE